MRAAQMPPFGRGPQVHRSAGRRRFRSLALAALALVALLPARAGAVNTAQPVIVSADPADRTPHVLDGRVNAIVQVGNRIVAGGVFTQVRDHGTSLVIPRANLLSFDATTGVIDAAFAPALDGRVDALAAAPDGTSVFVGGAFNTVNGTTVRKLVKLDVATGQIVTAFRASPTGVVKDLVVRGTKLYVAGAFLKIRGVVRSGLAAVDVTNGGVDPNLDLPFTDPRTGSMSVQKIDVAPDGERLVAIGNFTKVAGLDRNQIAILDLSSAPASVADWQTDAFVPPCSPSFDTYMRDVDFAPDGSYLAVVTTGASYDGTLCDSASRWEMGATGSGQQPTWVDLTGGDTLYSVAVTGTAIYVGGHQRWMNNPFADDAQGPGAVAREGIAALDPVNGLPFSWNPGRRRGVGVFAFLATPEGLWVGSDTTKLGGEYHARVGFFPVDGGWPVPPAEPGHVPGDLFAMETDGDLVSRSFDGSAFGAATTIASDVDWSYARGAFMLSGRLYTGWDDGTLRVRTFDGTATGAPATIPLNGLEAKGFNTHLSKATGMFFDSGRLYYTVTNDRKMYSRAFTPESGVIGAELTIVSGAGDGFDWRSVQGATLIDGTLYFTSKGGSLSAVPWLDGRPQGTPVGVSGPSIDGNDWRSRGLFMLSV